MPRYQEANPAFFSSVTFPFLFGVMFGDVGHGGVVLLLGIYLILFSDRLKTSKSLFSSFVPFRYLLALMGFFAFYAGFLYNDLFALGFDIFGSRWTEEGAEAVQGGVRLKQLVSDSTCVRRRNRGELSGGASSVSEKVRKCAALRREALIHSASTLRGRAHRTSC